MATATATAAADLEANLTAVAASESTPLIGGTNNIGGGENAGDDAPTRQEEDEPPPLKDIAEQTMKEKAVMGAAAVAFGSSLTAMVVEHNPMVYVSGPIGAVVGPYAALQQQKITQVEALRETNERMEQEVNILKEENVRLQGAVTDLEGSVQNLQDMEETLQTIRGMETASIDALEEQLAGSQEILSKMEKNLKGTILQNLISIVMECDKDGDMMIDDDELNKFMHHMENINGVQVKEELFRKKIIEEGRSLNAVMDVIRNLLDEDVAEEERIFDVENVEAL